MGMGRTDAHSTNLTGWTSSRSAPRTNAYTARILLVDGNTFSSCVRSAKRIRIVVCRGRQLRRSAFADGCRKGGKGPRTFGHRSRLDFSAASRAARIWRGALTSAWVRAASPLCASFRSAAVGVKYSSESGAGQQQMSRACVSSGLARAYAGVLRKTRVCRL